MSSVLLHCTAVLALLFVDYSVSDAPPHRPAPQYKVQFLHLQTQTPFLTALPPIERSSQARQATEASPPPPPKPAAAELPAPSRRAGTAKQTLMVKDAPPDLKLDKPIPLPTLEHWSQVAPPPPPAPTPPPPKIEVISRPDAIHHVDGVLVVPKVRQIAGESAPNIQQSLVDQSLPGQALLPVPKPPAPKPVAPPPAPSQPVAVQAAASAPPAATPAPAATHAPAGQGTQPQPSASKAAGNTAKPGAGQSAVDGEATPSNLARIDLPRGSKAPVSVMGESMAEQFPEAAGRMTSRVVSTVYLKVGLKRNWTLEYCLPADSSGASVGTAALEAPWAYTMFRPKDMLLDADTDVVLIHGKLSAAGKLEQLELLLPTKWSGKQLLFQALQRWQFRPAAKSGQPVAVEVMLVIPRQPDDDQ